MNRPLLRETYPFTPAVAELFPQLPAGVSRLHKVILPVARNCCMSCCYCRQLPYPCTICHSQQVDVLTPLQAARALAAVAPPFVVEIGGQGDPIMNEETFQTLRLLTIENITAPTFLTTTGLCILDRLDDILSVRPNVLKVIINSLDPKIGSRLVDSVIYRNKVVRGIDGAFLLQEKQVKGIKRLLAKGLTVAVETVSLSGLNAGHIPELVDALVALGIHYMDLRMGPGTTRDRRQFQRLRGEIAQRITLVSF